MSRPPKSAIEGYLDALLNEDPPSNELVTGLPSPKPSARQADIPTTGAERNAVAFTHPGLTRPSTEIEPQRKANGVNEARQSSPTASVTTLADGQMERLQTLLRQPLMPGQKLTVAEESTELAQAVEVKRNSSVLGEEPEATPCGLVESDKARSVHSEAEPAQPSTQVEPDLTHSITAVTESDNTVVSTPLEKPAQILPWLENGRPAWAQGHFDVLLLRVSGLTLAVPLMCLGQIYPLDEDLTSIFGQIEWFMGLQVTPLGKIRTVNTALFVMPERYNPAFLETAKYVVTMDGVGWGLAVDEVQQPIRLNPEDVTWRGQRSQRPWLAGTVKSAMCALLDIPQLSQILQSYEHSRHGS